MIYFLDRKAKDLFEELLNEALPSVTLKGTEYKAGKIYRYMSVEQFEESFNEFIDKCKEEALIVKTRSTNPKRQEMWTNTIDEFVILKRVIKIVEEMGI